MTAIPESFETRHDCTIVVDEFSRVVRKLDLESVQALLQALQLRLGTPEEQPCDLERAQLLGHEINNRLTPQKMQDSLRELGLLPVPPTP